MVVEEEGKINWHLGFQGGIDLELHPWKHSLVFEPEKELSKESLWLDLVVTKKDPELEMDHPIGRLMRQYSIFEYKSPEDSVSINDCAKTAGCALLYAGLGETVNKIPLNRTSVFLVRDAYPREMIEELRRLELAVTETQAGIYEISPRPLGMSLFIVVTGRMDPDGCPVLSLLRANADKRRAGEFIQRSDGLKEPGDLANIRAVLNILFAANPEIVEWIRRNGVMSEPLRDFVQPWLDESWKEGWSKGMNEGWSKGMNEGWSKGMNEGWSKGINEGRNEMIANMLREYLPVKTIAKYSKLPEAEIVKIARDLGVAPVN